MENQALNTIASDTAVGASGGGAVPVPAAPAVVPAVAPAIASPAPIPAEHIPTRKLIGEDDELPEGADEFVVKSSAFKRRIDRAHKKQLKEEFGTDDPTEIKTKLQELESFKAKQEEQRLAQLSETDRMREELDRYKQEAERYKLEASTVKETYEVREQDREIVGNAEKFFQPKYMNFVTFELSQHLQSVSEAALGDDPMKYINGWMKDFAEKNPAMAQQAPQPAPAAEPQVVVQKVVALNNGAQVTPPDRTQHLENKTATPNQPNSMSDSEWRDYKRKNGWNF
jgi:hypothetical protein